MTYLLRAVSSTSMSADKFRIRINREVIKPHGLDPAVSYEEDLVGLHRTDIVIHNSRIPNIAMGELSSFLYNAKGHGLIHYAELFDADAEQQIGVWK